MRPADVMASPPWAKIIIALVLVFGLIMGIGFGQFGPASALILAG